MEMIKRSLNQRKRSRFPQLVSFPRIEVILVIFWDNKIQVEQWCVMNSVDIGNETVVLVLTLYATARIFELFYCNVLYWTVL